MIPPTWMINELERRRRDREEQEQPRLWIDMPEPVAREGERSRRNGPREPIVIEL